MHIPSLVLMKKCILLCQWRGYITWRFNLNQQKRLLLQTKSIALCWTSSYQHINCNFALFALTSSCLCFQSLAHPLCWNKHNCQWVQGGAQHKHLPKCSSERHPTCIKQNFIPLCLAESWCHAAGTVALGVHDVKEVPLHLLRTTRSKPFCFYFN